MVKAPPTWETFRDRSYYDMWAVRMVGDRTFGQGVHVMTQAEAEGLRDLLNTTSQAEAVMTKPPSALLDQSCALGMIGTNVVIDCETRAEAEEVLDWLAALSETMP